jgi:hypothetical protein
MAGNANILVGCGGSGIRTLIRLNELLAEDSYWRGRVDDDIYYVLVDTDTASFDEFESAIRQQLHGATLPVVKIVRLAQGINNLQPTVDDYFIHRFAGSDAKGRERLLEHWWNRGPNDPFRAPKVKPLYRGAGQCPPVSYFLTWRSMRQIEHIFDDLIREIQKRKAGSGRDPLDELNFCVIGSVAGGTGRGCWSLVAFKMRQLFEKYGEVSTPVSFLFDCSAFPDVLKKHPEQGLSMRVNSLTGFGELACWMKNSNTAGQAQGQTYLYWLPSMDSPADDQTDVLRVSLAMDPSAAAPVDNSYLIFGGNETIHLDHSRQFQEMVGAALYAALSKSAIESAKINTHVPFRGLAAAMFEVNASTLRKYYEGLARQKATRQLELENESAIDAAVERFFKENALRLEITATDRSRYREDEKGNLLQRACSTLLRLYDNELAALREALEADDLEEVLSQVQGIAAEKKSAVEQAVDQVASKTDPVAGAEAMARELFHETGSVGCVRAFVRELQAELQGTLTALPSLDQMRLEEADEPLRLAESLAGREYRVFGRRFNEQECGEIADRTREAILYKNYGALREEIEKRYARWVAALNRWARNADAVLDAATRLLAKFRNEQRDACRQDYSGDLFDALFTDFDQPERAIPARATVTRFYRRELKPVFRRNEQESVLSGRVNFGKALPQLLLDTLLRGEFGPDAYDARDRLVRDLERTIRDEVHIENYEQFIEEQFSIRRVVDELRRAWRERFKSARNDRDRLNRLVEHFQEFFGVSPTRDGDDYQLPESDEFMLRMGASLAATCRPFWRLRDRRDTDHKVSLFLPPSPGTRDRSRARAQVQEWLGEGVHVDLPADQGQTDSLGQQRFNPFIILAYSTEGVNDMQQIASLDYWSEDSRALRWLDRCEDLNGESVFNQADDNKGIGYVDPLYVRNAQISSLRWKPWARGRKEQALANQALDALIYGLLEPAGKVKESLDKLKWSLPLVKNLGREKYAFTRPAYRWENGETVEDATTPWKLNQQIAQSICRVYDAFTGGRDEGKIKVPDCSAYRDRVLDEMREFFDQVAVTCGFGKGSRDLRDLLREHQKGLAGLRQRAEEDDEAVWMRLIQRIDELLKC